MIQFELKMKKCAHGGECFGKLMLRVDAEDIDQAIYKTRPIVGVFKVCLDTPEYAGTVTTTIRPRPKPLSVEDIGKAEKAMDKCGHEGPYSDGDRRSVLAEMEANEWSDEKMRREFEADQKEAGDE